jgi:hypothetical protein
MNQSKMIEHQDQVKFFENFYQKIF